MSSTALGLNKDCAFDAIASPADEPAHRNFLPARQAAVQMSALMWTAFLQSLGEIDTPVVVTCPPDLVVSTQPGQCSATWVDLGVPSVSGGCQTPSVMNDAPAQFPKGTNRVHCTALDASNNREVCSFTVRVQGAPEQIRDLTILVSSFHLGRGTERSLTSPLQSALDALAAGDVKAAGHSLQSFIDHANAQSGKKLTQLQSQSLVAAAKQIQAVMQLAPNRPSHPPTTQMNQTRP